MLCEGGVEGVAKRCYVKGEEGEGAARRAIQGRVRVARARGAGREGEAGRVRVEALARVARSAASAEALFDSYRTSEPNPLPRARPTHPSPTY